MDCRDVLHIIPPPSTWISVSAAQRETRLGREPRTPRSRFHWDPHYIQSHTSTLSQEEEGLHLLTGSFSSSVIRERSKATVQLHLGNNCQTAKAAMWAAAAAARNLHFSVSVSCFSPIIISLSEGVANLDSAVQVSLPFWAP